MVVIHLLLKWISHKIQLLQLCPLPLIFLLMRGKCRVYGDSLWEPKWLYLSSILTWYFLCQTTAVRPQTYLLLESIADKLYFVSLMFQKSHTLYTSSVYTRACLHLWSRLCVFESVSLSVSVCVCVCLSVCVACKYWKDGKRTFFLPENNWSPEPLRVAHPCEVRVRADQHLIIYQQHLFGFLSFFSHLLVKCPLVTY